MGARHRQCELLHEGEQVKDDDDGRLLICSRVSQAQLYSPQRRVIRDCTYCHAQVFVSADLLERTQRRARVVIACLQCAVVQMSKQPPMTFETDEEQLNEISAVAGRTVTREEFDRVTGMVGIVAGILRRANTEPKK